MSQEPRHYLTDLATLATLGLGGWWLWQKFATPAATPPARSDVDTCLVTNPTWTLGQCQGQLQNLRNVAQQARQEIAAITAGRATWLSLGNTDTVAKIDAAAAPWEAALSNAQTAYFNLTGSTL